MDCTREANEEQQPALQQNLADALAAMNGVQSECADSYNDGQNAIYGNAIGTATATAAGGGGIAGFCLGFFTGVITGSITALTDMASTRGWAVAEAHAIVAEYQATGCQIFETIAFFVLACWTFECPARVDARRGSSYDSCSSAAENAAAPASGGREGPHEGLRSRRRAGSSPPASDPIRASPP